MISTTEKKPEQQNDYDIKGHFDRFRANDL